MERATARRVRLGRPRQIRRRDLRGAIDPGEGGGRFRSTSEVSVGEGDVEFEARIELWPGRSLDAESSVG